MKNINYRNISFYVFYWLCLSTYSLKLVIIDHSLKEEVVLQISTSKV